MAGKTSGKIEGFKNLIAYQKAYELALETYRSTRNFPKEEIYGLTAQIRRAAVSIPSNICEGYRRCSRNDYIKFLRIAHKSCAELQTQLSLSHDLSFLENADFERLSRLGEDVSVLLWRLIVSLRESPSNPK